MLKRYLAKSQSLLLAALLIFSAFTVCISVSAEDGYTVTFDTSPHATINVYYTQDYTTADETDVTTTVSRSSDTGEPDSSGNGQINFTVVVDDGYEIEDINIEGSYKNIKGPSDTGVDNTYRITKITSDLVITVTTYEGEDEGYTVTFVTDENATINVYYTQDYTTADETDVSTTVSRNSGTGNPDSTGSGQINFTVVLEDGYLVDEIDVQDEGSYANIKGPADTGYENTYRITKITGNIVVTVTTVEGEDEGYAVTFVTDDNASVNVYYTHDYTTADETDVTSTVSRSSDSGNPDSSGDGQVNFTVVPADGYEVSDIEITGDYKAIKGPEDTGAENTYRITKVASELTVTVTVTATATEPTTEPTTEPEITYGDANGDGKITAADVLLIRKYLAKWDVADLIDLDNADANADGKVTAADVLLIRKYLAKWKNIELGSQE